VLNPTDRYIIYRKKYENNGAKNWRKLYTRVSPNSKEEFLNALAVLNKSRNRKKDILQFIRFSKLIYHYYPNGETVRCE
jgi:hypothetical protein